MHSALVGRSGGCIALRRRDLEAVRTPAVARNAVLEEGADNCLGGSLGIVRKAYGRVVGLGPYGEDIQPNCIRTKGYMAFLGS